MNLDKYGLTRIPKLQLSELKYFHFYTQYFSSLDENSRVLEIGPGNGSFSLFIQKEKNIPSANFTLLDFSQSTVEILRAQEETKDYQIVFSDVISYLRNVPDESYDFIVMRHVMEHMERSYITELVPFLEKKLTKGGKMLVEVPNFGNIPFGMYACFGDFSHLTVFTYESLVEAFWWNFTGEFEVATYGIYPFLAWRGTWLATIKDFITYLVKWFSIFITYLFYRNNGDRCWTGQVFTQFILAIVTKK